MFSFTSNKRNLATVISCHVTHYSIHEKALNLGVQSFIGFSGIQVSNNLKIGGILFFYESMKVPAKLGKLVKIFTPNSRTVGVYAHFPYSQFAEIRESFNHLTLPSFVLKMNLQSSEPEPLQLFRLIKEVASNPIPVPASSLAISE